MIRISLTIAPQLSCLIASAPPPLSIIRVSSLIMKISLVIENFVHILFRSICLLYFAKIVDRTNEL